MQAATRLEALHNGFPVLLTKIQQLDTTTLRSVITDAATDQSAAQTILRELANKPLRSIRKACLGPMLALVMALTFTDAKAEPGNNTAAKPVKWADLYADLFKTATGWLGWTPETAWNATLPEILHAYEGHMDKLKAIHGAPDDDQDGPTEEQRKQNVELGLDPDFDRAGLFALKEHSAAREGQAV